MVQQGPQDALYNGQSFHELEESMSVVWEALSCPSGIVQMIGVAGLGLSQLAKRPGEEAPIMMRDMHAGVATTFG